MGSSPTALAALSHLPKPAAKRLAVHITPAAERHLRSGHPWLFADSIVRQSHAGQPGDLAVIFDQKRRFLAIGLYDPHSPLRVRILQQGTAAAIDQAWFTATVAAAAHRRDRLHNDPQTTGYRLIYGENDGLPGLVVDRYATTLVIKLYSAAWIPHLPAVVVALQALEPFARFVLRLSRNAAELPEQLYGLRDGMLLDGAPLTEPLVFLENGLRFEADPINGQKTGFFLDQRENRATVEGLAADKRVLNVFAYNGGFSLYAARGGAHAVTSLDISQPALAAAERNFALNRTNPTVAAADHQLLAGDAFALLAQLAAAGERYDLVIVDPPAFAKRQREVTRALGAYAQLTRLGLGVLAPAGTIVLASCSSRISALAFVQNATLAAKQAGRPLSIFQQSGHPLDHPVSFPEGAYLKCIFASA